MTAIEWTDATWNPVTGCTKVSPGCDNCYAERFAERWRGTPGHPYEQGFDLKLWPGRLDIPRKWRKPRMVFVNSMSDLFHKDVPKDFIDRVFDTMEACPQHTFQVLTKRSSAMRNYINKRYEWDISKSEVNNHIWLGVSVEDERRMSRIKHLDATLGNIYGGKFLSCEPLLGPLPLFGRLTAIHWVIAGGESGPGHRPVKAEWLRQIRDACEAAKVPFFFKQWGGPRPKSGGHLLDGKEHREYPGCMRNTRLAMQKNVMRIFLSEPLGPLKS